MLWARDLCSKIWFNYLNVEGISVGFWVEADQVAGRQPIDLGC